MFKPQIYVFVSEPPSYEETQLVRIMTDAGYVPLIDAEHRHDYQWFIKTFENTPCRLFFTELDRLECYEISDITEKMVHAPTFVVYYNTEDEINAHDWSVISRYFEAMLYALTPPRTTSRRASMLLGIKEKILPIDDFGDGMDVDDFEVPEDYGFSCAHIEDRDMLLASIEKPYTDLPFTLVIREFKERGYLPIFSGLFISKAWGVCSADIVFLSKLWVHLKMKGEFNLEKIMEEAVARCLPSDTHIPEPEPELYRRTIDEVKQTLAKKESKSFVL